MIVAGDTTEVAINVYITKPEFRAIANDIQYVYLVVGDLDNHLLTVRSMRYCI